MSLSAWFKKTFRKDKPVRCKPAHGEDRVNGPEANYLRTSLPKGLAEPIAKETGATYADRTAYEEAQQALLSALRNHAPGDCSCDDWQIIYRHLVRHGYFRAAVVARERAISRSYADAGRPDAPALALHRGFTAGIDQADFGFAEECLERVIRSKRLRRDEVSRMQAYLDLNTGRLQAPDHRLLPQKGHYNAAFHEYLKGRSVAIVGPASSAIPHGDEIDAFDVVTRPNYSGKGTPLVQSETGQRVDVSFYANGIVKMSGAAQPNSQFKEWVDGLDWAIIKNHRLSLNADLARTGKVLIGARDDLMFHGTPTLVPVGLQTLLCYGAQRIKIFNSNFYFSPKPYAAYYHPELVASVASKLPLLFRSMAGHDYLSQVHCVRNLHRAGVVELSPDTLEVVNLSSAAYLEGLERIFVFPLYD